MFRSHGVKRLPFISRSQGYESPWTKQRTNERTDYDSCVSIPGVTRERSRSTKAPKYAMIRTSTDGSRFSSPSIFQLSMMTYSISTFLENNVRRNLPCFIASTPALNYIKTRHLVLWARQVTKVGPSTPMHTIRKEMAENTRGGRAVVLDDSGRLRGIITRTDLLRQVGDSFGTHSLNHPKAVGS